MQLWFQPRFEVLHFSEELPSPENIEGDTFDIFICTGLPSQSQKTLATPTTSSKCAAQLQFYRWSSLLSTLNNTFLALTEHFC